MEGIVKRTKMDNHDQRANDRNGSRREQLESSKSFPLYLLKRKSAPISNTSG